MRSDGRDKGESGPSSRVSAARRRFPAPRREPATHTRDEERVMRISHVLAGTAMGAALLLGESSPLRPRPPPHPPTLRALPPPWRRPGSRPASTSPRSPPATLGRRTTWPPRTSTTTSASRAAASMRLGPRRLTDPTPSACAGRARGPSRTCSARRRCDTSGSARPSCPGASGQAPPIGRPARPTHRAAYRSDSGARYGRSAGRAGEAHALIASLPRSRFPPPRRGRRRASYGPPRGARGVLRQGRRGPDA